MPCRGHTKSAHKHLPNLAVCPLVWRLAAVMVYTRSRGQRKGESNNPILRREVWTLISTIQMSWAHWNVWEVSWEQVFLGKFFLGNLLLGKFSFHSCLEIAQRWLLSLCFGIAGSSPSRQLEARQQPCRHHVFQAIVNSRKARLEFSSKTWSQLQWPGVYLQGFIHPSTSHIDKSNSMCSKKKQSPTQH